MVDWITAGLTAFNVGASLFSGGQAARTSNYNAASSMNYAIANSNAIRQAGAMNAGNIMAAGRVNASLARQGSGIQAELARMMGGVNADIARKTAYYNSMLLETEVKDFLQEKDYLMTELDKEFRLWKGQALVFQGSSGTIIGEGSNAQHIINNQAEYELNKMVLNMNYDDKIRDISNQQMTNAYQGELAAFKYMFEAEAQAIGALTSGAMQAGGALAQAGIDASATQANAAIGAWQTYNEGSWQSQQYSQQAKQDWTSGIVNAVGSGISTYSLLS